MPSIPAGSPVIAGTRSRSWPAFALDDRTDATAAFPLLTR